MYLKIIWHYKKVHAMFCLDLKTALGKKRRDGKSAPLQPLTTMQRVHLRPLIEKYGDNYEVHSW